MTVAQDRETMVFPKQPEKEQLGKTIVCHRNDIAIHIYSWQSLAHDHSLSRHLQSQETEQQSIH